MGDYKKHRRDLDDDDYKYHSSSQQHKSNTLERILTPGTATNNVIKTAATGIIAGGTIILMGVYGLFGDSLAGSAYLPMATAVSSAVATACVWIFGRPKAEEQRNAEIRALNKQVDSLNQTIEEMQRHFDAVDKRLGNVEVLESFEDRLARKTIDEKISSTLPKHEKQEPVAESSYMSPESE